MDTATHITTNLAFELKGSLFTLTVLHLKTSDIDTIAARLKQLTIQTPKFFQNIPVVLDLQALQDWMDFSRLITCLREHKVIPVGIRGGNTKLQNAAVEAGLAIFPNTKADIATSRQESKTVSTNKSNLVAAKVITQPVRSGQQIYAKHTDLIVLSSVSHGAELLADGHIHIYGTLRGRALAGITGNQEARIFCHNLEADLVAIAGHYWVSEDLQNSPLKQNVHIYLENERLHVASTC